MPQGTSENSTNGKQVQGKSDKVWGPFPDGYVTVGMSRIKTPMFANVEEERLHRKQRLAAMLRLFAKYGYDEGTTGHVTCRDPENPETFWVNPYGLHFSQIKASDLALVNKKGEVLYSNGDTYINQIGVKLHSMLYDARPDIICATHCHSTYSKAFSSLVRLLDPITQDSCVFYEDHALYSDYGGIITDYEEGRNIAKALGKKKAVILCNHGLVTVGHTIDEAAYLAINMEKCCQVQLLAEAACHGNEKPIQIKHECAKDVHKLAGSKEAGWFSFQPLYQMIVKEQPDLLL